MHPREEREKYITDLVLCLYGPKVGGLGFQGFSSLLANQKHQRGIRVPEGRSVATEVVSYLSYSGISERGSFVVGWRLEGGSLFHFF